MGGAAVWWKGSQFDARTRDMLVEAEQLCGLNLQPSQGSWSGASASAGTHSGCGAYDGCIGYSAAQMDEAVAALRRVGFAAWRRTSAQGFTPHVHAIAVQPGGKGDRGCLHASAHDQVVDYYEGRNGLANNGADDGPRSYVGTTWETYQGGKEPEPGWLLEGVIDMAANTVVFFVHADTWFEADLIAGTYRAFSSHDTLVDRRHVLGKAGVPWINWEDGAPVGNPDAFGVLVS